MRTKRRVDYGFIARQSVKADITRFQRKINASRRQETGTETREEPRTNTEKRIVFISETSTYYKFAKFIVGKLVRLKERANVGSNSWYCEFVHETDSLALNRAAGWSDRKKEYLFDGVKFDR